MNSIMRDQLDEAIRYELGQEVEVTTSFEAATGAYSLRIQRGADAVGVTISRGILEQVESAKLAKAVATIFT